MLCNESSEFPLPRCNALHSGGRALEHLGFHSQHDGPRLAGYPANNRQAESATGLALVGGKRHEIRGITVILHRAP